MDSIIPVKDDALWVKGSPNYKLCGKIPNSLRLHLIKHIDTKHAKGKEITCLGILNWLRKNHSVYCRNNTLSRAMLDIGLSYKTIKPKIRNNNVARLDQIRYYLISMYALLNIDK